MNDEFQFKVGVNPDTSSVQKKLDKEKFGIKANIDPKIDKKSFSSVTGISEKIFNKSDLESQGRIYFSKISRTIDKMMPEIRAKFSSMGFDASSLKVTGLENAKGTIKGFTVSVEDGTRALKKFNFERQKLQLNGKAQGAFIQTDNIGISANSLSQIQKKFDTAKKFLQADLQTNMGKWDFSGVFDGEFKSKVLEAKTLLDSATNPAGLDKYRASIKLIKEEYKQISTASASIKKEALSQQQLVKFDAQRLNSLQGIETYLKKNERLTSSNSQQAKELIAWFERLRAELNDLSSGDNAGLSKINKDLSTAKSRAKALGLEGASFTGLIKENFYAFSNWFAIGGVVAGFTRNIREAVTELKNMDSILTEISKTSDMTPSQIKELGKDSFDLASIYGKKASDYLLGIQEMARAGYKNTENMSELSILAQAAGDMSPTIANDYLIATDAAYKLRGEEEKLNEVLSGQNMVTNRNALSMSDLAEATKIAASQAASADIPIENLTAMVGTMIASTRQGGDQAARALKGVIMNIQQVSGTVDEETGEIINADDLRKYEVAVNDLGVSLKEVKNGYLALRNPISVLRDLSKAYTSLNKDDSRRANLISSVGGKYRGNQLNALLENWDMYEKMLSDYSQGSGSAYEEAMKSANNWEGSLNRLSNTWTELVNNFIDSSWVTGSINGINNVTSAIESLISTFKGFPTITAVLGGILGAKGLGWANDTVADTEYAQIVLKGDLNELAA